MPANLAGVIQVKSKNIVFDLNKAFHLTKILKYPVVVHSYIKYRYSSQDPARPDMSELDTEYILIFLIKAYFWAFKFKN